MFISNLFNSLMKSFIKDILKILTIRFIMISLAICNPLIFGMLIQFFQTHSVTFQCNKKIPFWHGYLLGTTLTLASITHVVLQENLIFLKSQIGIKIESALIGLIYQKSLKIPQNSKLWYNENKKSEKKLNSSEISNLMSIDARRVGTLPAVMPILIYGILFIPLLVSLIYRKLGLIPVLSMITLLFIMIFAIVKFTKALKRYQNSKLKNSDLRIKNFNAILRAIHTIKIHVWENFFIEKVGKIRQQECASLKSLNYTRACLSIMVLCFGIMLLVCSFTTFVAIRSISKILNPATTFQIFLWMNHLTYLVSEIPNALDGVVKAAISIRRIENFLSVEELTTITNCEYLDDCLENSVDIKNATFSWSLNDETNQNYDIFCLKKINLKIPKGSLVAIIGQTGSGKSSLIDAILGEIPCLDGRVAKLKSIAYVNQRPWCLNESLRKNIILNRPFKKKLYESIIKCCCLDLDIQQFRQSVTDSACLTDGDEILIGENGVNLSGGQKSRVSIARAVYQQADLYLFDDPLAAVDIHVANKIFDKVIAPKGCLAKTTRIIVTNCSSYLAKMDKIIVMKNGQIECEGTYEDLISQPKFQSYLNHDYQLKLEKIPASIKMDIDLKEKILCDRGSPEDLRKNPKEIIDENAKFVETFHKKSISWNVYLEFLNACKKKFIFVSLLFYCAYVASNFYSNTNLSAWANMALKNRSHLMEITNNITALSNAFISEKNWSFSFFCLFGILAIFFIGIHLFLFAKAFSVSSNFMHSVMLKKLLSAPITFFDVTSHGSISNRFINDINVIDLDLPLRLTNFLVFFAGVIILIVLSLHISPWIMLVLLIISFIFTVFQSIYMKSVRQMKRLELVCRSQIYAQFEQTVSNLSNIRSFNVNRQFIKNIQDYVDKTEIVMRSLCASISFIGVFLALTSSLIQISLIFFALKLLQNSNSTMNTGFIALAISMSINGMKKFAMLMKIKCDLESFLVNLERIYEYSHNLPTEAKQLCQIDQTLISTNWPNAGQIMFDNVYLKYEQAANYSLKKISFYVNSGEKIGIVGRTGAGKSTLAKVLLRLIEIDLGTIIIDNVDISQIGLNLLRSKITIISQDPVMFNGTIRSNLDPSEDYTDDHIWSALEAVSLKGYVETSFCGKGLNFEIETNGEEISVGQRQLFSLARGLLRQTKILILDEATASLDNNTDLGIQNTLRSDRFTGMTILTIAHRVSTILDYDRILVMDEGEIIEFDSVKNLKADENSEFFKILTESNLNKF